MGGKSTYMRQTALILVLALCGSWVPASMARIGPIDRIFTRIGSSDDLAGGRSTFMVEMTETANILHNATPFSLVLMDEIGRGTSTFDGLSLAWAAAVYITEKLQAYTLFATHYFELTSLPENYSNIANNDNNNNDNNIKNNNHNNSNGSYNNNNSNITHIMNNNAHNYNGNYTAVTIGRKLL